MSNKYVRNRWMPALCAVLAIATIAVVAARFFLAPLVSTTNTNSKQGYRNATVTDTALVNQKIQQATLKKSANPISDTLVDLWQLDKKNQFKNTITNKDKTGKTHARYKQLYAGIPVWGGDVIVHANQQGDIKKITGKKFDGLEKKLAGIDLQNPKLSSMEVLDSAKQKAGEFINHVTADQFKFRNEKTELIIYADNEGAHQAYHVDYVVETSEGNPARPNFMIDANTGKTLKQWDGLATALIGTGPGGNLKIGQHEFGVSGFYDYLDVTQSGGDCVMTDQFNYLSSVNLGGTVSSSTTPFVYPCFRNTYRFINDAYSPINDGHYYGRKTVDMYQAWLGAPPKPGSLFIRTGYGVNVGGANWDGTAANFGDGDSSRFPLSSAADVVAHEISHAFTEVNSALLTVEESGAINESFSDMGGEALEYYWKGTNDWMLAADAVKAAGKALRYFQNPKLDGKSPTHKTQYLEGDSKQHLNGGIFNRAFYLTANLSGWDIRKAFEVFAAANQNYWTVLSEFNDASCGVLDAAVDAGYDPDPVRLNFQSVGVFCDDASIMLDADEDGMSDGWEASNGLNTTINDAELDADADTFSNTNEHKAGSDPQNQVSVPIQTAFRESFEASTLPVDWKTTFGSDTAWTPIKSSSFATHGLYGLSSKPLTGKYSQVEFTGNFINGTSLTFSYKVKQGSGDSFKLYIDGELRFSVTGVSTGTLWSNQNIEMTGGQHTVLFQYQRSSTSPSGGAAYIDNIQYTRLETDTDGDGVGNGMDTDDDNDGALDTAELAQGTNPLVVDTDGDGFADGVDSYPADDTRIGIRGTVAGANFGTAVATADVNGDGFDDIVAGSPKEDPINQTTGLKMTDAGTVKVYSGADGALLYLWLGETTGDNFGISIANAGDVNNDGDDDVIIGATGFDPIAGSSKLSNAGAAYVYSGQGVLGTKLYRFNGEVAGDNFGVAVAGGNINNDTNSDLVVGANLADPLDLAGRKMSSAGRVYAYSGSDFTQLNRWDGQTAGDAFGTAVAVSDINNDGRDDIIIGAPKRDVVTGITLRDAGTVYVYSGDGFAELNRWDGLAAGDAFGSSVAAGTIDEEAGNDVVVGAPLRDVVVGTILKDAGAIYAYTGVSYGSIPALSKTGSATGDAFGTALVLGPIDGVTGDDVVVGICKSDYKNAALKLFKDAGSANVYSGIEGNSLITGSPLTGTTATQKFGCAVASGDTNNDGVADVIIGSPNADPSAVKDAGSIDVYLGDEL